MHSSVFFKLWNSEMVAFHFPINRPDQYYHLCSVLPQYFSRCVLKPSWDCDILRLMLFIIPQVLQIAILILVRFYHNISADAFFSHPKTVKFLDNFSTLLHKWFIWIFSFLSGLIHPLQAIHSSALVRECHFARGSFQYSTSRSDRYTHPCWVYHFISADVFFSLARLKFSSDFISVFHQLLGLKFSSFLPLSCRILQLWQIPSLILRYSSPYYPIFYGSLLSAVRILSFRFLWSRFRPW